jgi:hypothetical protein
MTWSQPHSNTWMAAMFATHLSKLLNNNNFLGSVCVRQSQDSVHKSSSWSNGLLFKIFLLIKIVEQTIKCKWGRNRRPPPHPDESYSKFLRKWLVSGTGGRWVVDGGWSESDNRWVGRDLTSGWMWVWGEKSSTRVGRGRENYPFLTIYINVSLIQG